MDFEEDQAKKTIKGRSGRGGEIPHWNSGSSNQQSWGPSVLPCSVVCGIQSGHRASSAPIPPGRDRAHHQVACSSSDSPAFLSAMGHSGRARERCYRRGVVSQHAKMADRVGQVRRDRLARPTRDGRCGLCGLTPNPRTVETPHSCLSQEREQQGRGIRTKKVSSFKVAGF